MADGTTASTDDTDEGRNQKADIRSRLAVYDIAGQRVRTLAEGVYKPGACESVRDCRDEKGRTVGAGVHFYSLEAGDFCEKRKCVLAR